ncbi:DUF4328 domain-containing protein [Streptomyces sp. CA-278952]|uniref:DUF4328 domain-containing protein n=1 Tax=Streptomyces sp. CA-278952 TaxID=2980556 RepID=UPI0023680E1A|nr:DUF4328 domain-containing protein [Streptomyces sp. CA-278952]WDG33491.1 DUF4328 domain-containing protein [Streptomyces sp. CA-278952]
MLCTRCRIRTAVTDDGLCTFCSGTRPPLPGGATAPVSAAGLGVGSGFGSGSGSGGWGVGTWPRSPVGLSRAVVALLGCVIASDLFVIAAGLHLRGLWEGLAADESLNIYTGPGLRAQELYDLAGTVQTAAFLATGVLFIIWFHRTRRNAEVFESGVQRMGPGWAVGGWFVPVANLWFPYRVASGIWEASVRLHPDGGWRTVPKTVLNLWWGGWIVSVLASRIAVSQWNRAQEPEQIADAAALVAAADALDLVAAVLAVLFVRAVTRMQGERAGIGQAATSPERAASEPAAP